MVVMTSCARLKYLYPQYLFVWFAKIKFQPAHLIGDPLDKKASLKRRPVPHLAELLRRLFESHKNCKRQDKPPEIEVKKS